MGKLGVLLAVAVRLEGKELEGTEGKELEGTEGKELDGTEGRPCLARNSERIFSSRAVKGSW